MGIISTSTTNRFGVKTETKVVTNKLEDFVIRVFGRFGHKLEWRIVHWIERRKLRRTRK